MRRDDNSPHMWWSVLGNLDKLSSSDPVQTSWKDGEDDGDVGDDGDVDDDGEEEEDWWWMYTDLTWHSALA